MLSRRDTFKAAAIFGLTPLITPLESFGLMPSDPPPVEELFLNPEVHYRTGIPELDKELGGGILGGSLVMIVGEPGTGKTALLRTIMEAQNSPMLQLSRTESYNGSFDILFMKKEPHDYDLGPNQDRTSGYLIEQDDLVPSKVDVYGLPVTPDKDWLSKHLREVRRNNLPQNAVTVFGIPQRTRIGRPRDDFFPPAVDVDWVKFADLVIVLSRYDGTNCVKGTIVKSRKMLLSDWIRPNGRKPFTFDMRVVTPPDWETNKGETAGLVKMRGLTEDEEVC